MGFNNFLNENNVIKKEYTQHKISDSIFESICSDLFQTDDESKIKMSKLDKRRKANLIRDYDDELMSKFKRDGYISLNTFCDLFRTDIKMNYNTLYKRLNNNNENIPQYINDKGYILSYKKVNKSSGSVGSRVYTIVNYERYGDFIDCIVSNFLNKEQKEFEIVSGGIIMSKFKSLRYSTLNKPHFTDSKNITLETFKNICFKYFKNDLPINDNYNALNRVKGTFLGRVDDDIISSTFKKNGHIPLNTFCDFKRLDLVVAYNTIYKRIDKDDRIARYLNDNEYIYIYYKKKKDGSIGVRKNIAVNYEKHIDFIKLIRDNFISDKQSKTIIKVKNKKTPE